MHRDQHARGTFGIPRAPANGGRKEQMLPSASAAVGAAGAIGARRSIRAFGFAGPAVVGPALIADAALRGAAPAVAPARRAGVVIRPSPLIVAPGYPVVGFEGIAQVVGDGRIILFQFEILGEDVAAPDVDG